MNRPNSEESQPNYGETWVYEGLIGAIPGLSLDIRTAVILQFLAFETAVLVLAWVYGLPGAVVAGTATVSVATAGSVMLVRIGRLVREVELPAPYRRLLFGSNGEVLLAVLAYTALVTHLFVFDPRASEQPLLDSLLGTDPPVAAVYLTLLVLWDLCYRISVGWWAAVAALWRSVHYRFDADTRQHLRRVDLTTAGFGLVQLALVPFLLDQPLLLAAVVGHIVAVLVVTGAAIEITRVREKEPAPTS